MDFGKGSSNCRYEFGKYSAVRREHSLGIKLFHFWHKSQLSYVRSLSNQARASVLFLKSQKLRGRAYLPSAKILSNLFALFFF